MRYVIIGNGGAGVRAARAIRERDGAGTITMVDPEPYRCYYRMRLPDYISGWRTLDSIYVVDEDFYAGHDIRLLAEERVTRVIAEKHLVVLERGGVLDYDRLLIASGARPRTRPCPGSDLDGVVYLRTMDNARDILERAGRAKRAVVLGGGLLGVELARCFNELGLKTHYLFLENRFWPQMLDTAASSLVEEVLLEKGIHLHKEEGLAEISGSKGKVKEVTTAAGNTLEADMVGVAIGVLPNVEMLEGSGIETARGVIVDDRLRTNQEDVFAAGDVAQAYDVVHGEHRVVTSWLNSQRQGEAAGINMSGGDAALGGVVPFNVITIYGLPVASIGLGLPPEGEGYQSLSGDYPKEREYRKLVLRDGMLVGAVLIGDIREARALEALIKAQADVSGYRDRLFEPGFDANQLLKDKGGN